MQELTCRSRLLAATADSRGIAGEQSQNLP